MPPALFVAADSAIIGVDSVRFEIPTTSKAGDTLLAIVARKTSDAAPVDPDDWTAAATFVGATYTIHVYRRERVASESAHVDIAFDGNIVDPALGVIAVYRNLNTGADLVASSSANVAASVNYPCPSLVLSTYSDLYIGIPFLATNEVAITPPAGGTTRIHNHGDGMTLDVFDVLREAVGASGVQIAVAASAQTGIAAALVLAAGPVIGVGKSFSFDPIGAIGLPSRGV